MPSVFSAAARSAPAGGPDSGRVPELSLEMHSNPLFLSGARELIAAVAKRLGFSDEACGQIALAVDEALCNVIRHGYDREPRRPIWLRVYPEGGGWAGGASVTAPGGEGSHAEAVRIVIEDEGRQVDPATIKSRDLNEVRPGGLGVHIIRSVMDDVAYEQRAGGHGMRLTMVKRRIGSAAGPGASAARGGAACADGGCEARGCGGGSGAGQ